ncbi:MAG: hypothetical protein RLZZ504_845, partial [Bacteroidota bacterium]
HAVFTLCFGRIIGTPLRKAGTITDDQNDVFWGFGLFGLGCNYSG